MKCVKAGSEIMRVSDAKAAELVKRGGKYIKKSEWRKADPKGWAERRSASKSEEK